MLIVIQSATKSHDLHQRTVFIVVPQKSLKGLALQCFFKIFKSLQISTTGVKMFSLFNFFHKKNQIPWNNCVAICTDGAKAMIFIINSAVHKVLKILQKLF